MKSYIHPITILSTLPSAGVGAILALLAFKMDFSIIALIGVILLIGIVKKNAILMIDFALEAERQRGLNPRDAIHEAVSCVSVHYDDQYGRLVRCLAVALGTGMGAELRQHWNLYCWWADCKSITNSVHDSRSLSVPRSISSMVSKILATTIPD